MQTLTSSSRSFIASILLGASMSGAIGHATGAQGLLRGISSRPEEE